MEATLRRKSLEVNRLVKTQTSAIDIYAPVGGCTPIDYIKIFAENVKRLMAAEDPPLSQPALAAKAKMHQRTLGRIINQEVTPQLDMMAKIAHGLDVALWQLLIHGIDPKNLPALAPVTQKERELWKTIQQAAQELGQYGKPPGR